MRNENEEKLIRDNLSSRSYVRICFYCVAATNENKLQAEEISDKQSQVTQLSSQLETSEAIRADTNVKLNNINSKLINTENKLNTVSHKLNDAENQLTAQKSSISKLQKDKDKLKQDIETLEKNNPNQSLIIRYLMENTLNVRVHSRRNRHESRSLDHA